MNLVASSHARGTRASPADEGWLNRDIPMGSIYTAVIQSDGKWWIGWIEEIPGVNAQARTRTELLDDLRSALVEALEMNRADALAAASSAYEEVTLQV
jgi:predicted RNase H-like HicB family nuclease